MQAVAKFVQVQHLATLVGPHCRLKQSCIQIVSFTFFLLGLATYSFGEEQPELFRADLEQKGLQQWDFSDPTAWKLVNTPAGSALALTERTKKYQPKVRSPHHYALIKDLTVTDCVIDLKLKSTVADYGHRDLCLFFGFQDAEHFYYLHLAKQADNAAHSIFIVNGAPRTSIASERTAGVNWTDDWHHVRLHRNVQNGVILVCFDDMETPIMKAVDKTFTWGRVGIGSFDDTGMFREIVVTGKLHQP